MAVWIDTGLCSWLTAVHQERKDLGTVLTPAPVTPPAPPPAHSRGQGSPGSRAGCDFDEGSVSSIRSVCEMVEQLLDSLSFQMEFHCPSQCGRSQLNTLDMRRGRTTLYTNWFYSIITGLLL